MGGAVAGWGAGGGAGHVVAPAFHQVETAVAGEQAGAARHLTAGLPLSVIEAAPVGHLREHVPWQQAADAAHRGEELAAAGGHAANPRLRLSTGAPCDSLP